MSELAKALAAAQAQMGNAMKDSDNPHFRSKYADLASVRAACLPALNANGIAVVQPFQETETGQRYVQTILMHTSGESVECAVPVISAKNDMQGLGSAITYARRYGLMAMAGVAPEDDDGNAAAASVKNPQSAAIADAWKQAVLDSLPDNPTPEQSAAAFTDAIIDGFKAKTGEKALSNEWDRRKKITAHIESKFPEMHAAIVDAYENKMLELADKRRGSDDR